MVVVIVLQILRVLLCSISDIDRLLIQLWWMFVAAQKPWPAEHSNVAQKGQEIQRLGRIW